VGVPDARWGEVGLAAVVPREGATLEPEEVRSFLKERLARYKVPKHVRTVVGLPKSGAGKILKNELRDAFQGSGATKGGGARA